MRYLLDTHVVIWMAKKPERLPPPIRTLVTDTRNELLVSVATAWEIGVKRSKGRLDFGDIDNVFLENFHLRLLPIELRHTAAIAALPRHHSDPFDRMLVAQAKVDRLTFITQDSDLRAYDVDILW